MTRLEKTEERICNEILDIMEAFDTQLEENGEIGTPGGLEHMGDVWNLLRGWQQDLLKAGAR